MFEYSHRVERLQELMGKRDIDVVLLTAGSDLKYLSGYEAMPLERITAFVILRTGAPTLFVPALEAARVREGEFETVSWNETDDPFRMIADKMGAPRKVAVGETMWSGFLLEFQREMEGEWSIASALTRELRMLKEPGEIDRLRRAAEAADRVLARVPEEVQFAGRSEREIASDFARMTVEEGHDNSWFAIIASGSNSASPHHETGRRTVESGDMVVCDFGGALDGYHSDVTRTFVVGPPSQRQSEVHDVVLAANQAGRDAVRPGASCEEVDRAARRVIDDAGYGKYFIHRTGHGIGLEGHEHPYIVEGNPLPLESGMAFSIEPGIYIPGEFGVRIEDIVTCRPDGLEDLNHADRGVTPVT